MISVQNLCKNYGAKKALDNVSFTVSGGGVVGLLGPNGAGKSTTMNIISGFTAPSSGTVEINGISLLEDPVACKKRIGYLPENPPLYPDMTVSAYLSFMFDLKKLNVPKKAHIAEVCAACAISDVFGRLIKNLSKGYKQRLGLAQAMLGSPPLLILDEPTSGLDPVQIVEVRALIRRLAETAAVILSSHILPEIEATAGRIIVINKGRIIADDTPEKIASSFGKENMTLEALFIKLVEEGE
jgi:ABC-2 type transport system ATP-binding protein